MAGTGYQVYVTFSGESATPIQCVRGYSADGSTYGNVTPNYDELRGMALDFSGQLYLAVADQSVSAVDVFSAQIGSDGYSRTFLGSVVTPASSSALLHPYMVQIGDAGMLYVSSQDTNVISGYQLNGSGTATPLSVAPYLAKGSWGSGTFYPGTLVASAQPVTNGGDTPPVVPAAQGGLTMTGFTSTPSPADAKKPAKHSVRGFLFADNVCYVADEGGARVGIYNPYSGEYLGALTTTHDGKYTLKTPVALAYNGTTLHLYIGDPGNSAIFKYHAKTKKLELVIDGKSGGVALDKLSGMAFTPDDGTLLFASRGQSAIYALTGSTLTTFAGGLSDSPECLLVVPMR